MNNSRTVPTDKRVTNRYGAIVTVCWILVWAVVLRPDVAHAYIDPGSGSAIITAILGAIGAVGYTFRKYYYKIKNLFRKNVDKTKK